VAEDSTSSSIEKIYLSAGTPAALFFGAAVGLAQGDLTAKPLVHWATNKAYEWLNPNDAYPAWDPTVPTTPQNSPWNNISIVYEWCWLHGGGEDDDTVRTIDL
jgi:hypothetical protein